MTSVRRDVEEQRAGGAAPAVLETLAPSRSRRSFRRSVPRVRNGAGAAHPPAAERSCWLTRRDAPARGVRPRPWLARASGCPRRRVAGHRCERRRQRRARRLRCTSSKFDQVGGVSPRRKPLDGDVTVLVFRATIDDLDAHPGLVEGSVSGELAQRPPTAAMSPLQDVVPVGADRIGHVPRCCRRTQALPRPGPEGNRCSRARPRPSRGTRGDVPHRGTAQVGCHPAGSTAWPAHPPLRRTDTSPTGQPSPAPTRRAHERDSGRSS